jgi:hypothetical protein
MQAARPVPAGLLTSNCRNEGLACTHRRAFIRLERIAKTPFEPGGIRAALSSITTYGSTSRPRATDASASQKASRYQRIAIPQ